MIFVLHVSTENYMICINKKWQTQKKSVWFPAISQLQPARRLELEEKWKI